MNEDKKPYSLNKRLKFILFPDKNKERDSWKNLEINIDAFCDKWKFYETEFIKLINEFTPSDLLKICEAYGLKNSPTETIQSVLLNDVKVSVLLFCCLKFALNNLKLISTYFNIPIRSGHINRPKVFMETIFAYRKNKLPELFLIQYAQKKGSAKIPFDMTTSQTRFGFTEAEIYIQKLIRHLNTYDPEGREHLLRFSANANNTYYFLVLKETEDKIYPALPENHGFSLASTFLLNSWPKKTG